MTHGASAIFNQLKSLRQKPTCNNLFVHCNECAKPYQNFSAIIRPLSKFLEQLYDQAGKRTKSAAGRIILFSMGWGKTHGNAFRRCSTALEQPVTRAHRYCSTCLCVYTDASDIIWSSIITQIPPGDLSKEHVDRHYQPIAFLSGHFFGPQLEGFTLEKKAFAVMVTV